MYVSILSFSFPVKFICEFFASLSKVVCPTCCWLGTLQIGIIEKICLLSDDARPVGGWGRYKMVLKCFLE
jgi:hypothetical protein